MKDSIKYGDEGGKNFGCVADELTPQACYRSRKKYSSGKPGWFTSLRILYCLNIDTTKADCCINKVYLSLNKQFAVFPRRIIASMHI